MPELSRVPLTTDVHASVFTTTGPASYATGGFDLGLAGTPILVLIDNDGGYVGQYDYTAKKLKAFRNGAINLPHVEETAAVNLSAVNFRVVAFVKP
jgi:hypothetical protein